jgi:hypothetical protein
MVGFLRLVRPDGYLFGNCLLIEACLASDAGCVLMVIFIVIVDLSKLVWLLTPGAS